MIKKVIEDYDDYYDACQELGISPLQIKDEEFLTHWSEMERYRHRDDIIEENVQVNSYNRRRHSNI